MDNQAIQPVKLTSNENPFGPPPGALAAIRRNSPKINFYAELVPMALKEKLAAKYNLSPANITVAAGSFEMINIIIHFLVNEEEEILTFDKTFMAYGYLAHRNRRKCVFANLTNLVCDVNNLIPLCGDKTRAIFIANPNNPTGTIVTHDSLRTLLEAVSPGVLVVVDEAYYEYVTDETYPYSQKLLKEFPNLIILRTFSKIYGLAGLRVGYAITDEKIAVKLEKYRLLRSVNYLAEKAAIAALDEEEFIRKCAAFNDRERTYLYEEIHNLGYDVHPSQANFIYLPFRDDESKTRVYEHLADNGLLVFDLKFFRQKNSLRISVGKSEINKRLIASFKNLR